MLTQSPQITALTYCSLPYAGVGWPQSCVSILAGFSGTPVAPTLVLPRSRVALPRGIDPEYALGQPLANLPWRLVSKVAKSRLDDRFARLLDQAEPSRTVAYFWPGAPLHLVEQAKARGILTVREMINTAQASAKPILDDAYARLGLRPRHTITDAAIAGEGRELELYDLIFASNTPCEASLQALGIAADRIVATSFGWSPARLGQPAPVRTSSAATRFLFVGSLSVRKGIPELVEAWRTLAANAVLTLVGNVEPALEPMISAAAAAGTIEVLPFTRDIGALYRRHDVFVFPTLEEGGPQVTIEAGGCGLPVITTPMGAARLVRNGVNGIVVPAGAVEPLRDAIATLAENAPLRQQYGRRIIVDAQAFTYDKLGAQRAAACLAGLKRRNQPELASHG